MKVYDDVNRKMGEVTLRISIQGIENKWTPNHVTIAFGNLILCSC